MGIIYNSTRACASPSFWRQRLSFEGKRLKNESNRPRASEAADRGKHAYPDGELQIAENPLEGGASLGSQ